MSSIYMYTTLQLAKEKQIISSITKDISYKVIQSYQVHSAFLGLKKLFLSLKIMVPGYFLIGTHVLVLTQIQFYCLII